MGKELNKEAKKLLKKIKKTNHKKLSKELDHEDKKLKIVEAKENSKKQPKQKEDVVMESDSEDS